jgi:hypothetical protein
MANPYASPSDVAASIEPIRFGFGERLTLADHEVALHDGVPAKGIKRLQRPLTSVLFIVFVWFVLIQVQEPGKPLPAFAWVFAGASVCPFWIAILSRFGRKRRQLVERVRRSAQQAKPTFGTIAQEYFYESDSDTVVRCSWDHFGRVFLFPAHLVLPVAFDPQRRVVIPWRFFASPGHARQVSRFVVERLGTVVNQMPSDQQLVSLMQCREEANKPEKVMWPYDNPTQFDKDHWPNVSSQDPRQQEQPIDCQIDLSADMSSWKYIGKSSILIVGYIALIFLPVLIAACLWVIGNYWLLNSWRFLTEHRWSSTLVVLPIVGVTFLILRAAFISLSYRRSQNASGLSMRFGDDGFYMSGLTFDSWLSHDAIENWILDEDSFGWTLRETGEDMRIPSHCFTDPEKLSQLKERASRQSNAIDNRG